MSALTMLQRKTEEFKRGYLDDLLSRLNERQRKMFHGSVYPKGISEDQLPDAIALCERTLGMHK